MSSEPTDWSNTVHVFVLEANNLNRHMPARVIDNFL